LQIVRERGFENLAEERIVGAFASKSIRSKRWSFPGMELYATDKRLLGFKIRKLGMTSEPGEAARGKGMWIVALADHYADKEVAQIENAKHITELEKKKNREFEVKKDEVSEIVITKPPGIAKFGHIKIILKSKPEIDLQFSDKSELEPISTLMERFFPSGVKVQE
jgi:hypothetical protein